MSALLSSSLISFSKRRRGHRVRLHRIAREGSPQEWLDAARRNLGTLNFSAQYQQNALPAEGNVIKREWIHFYGLRSRSPSTNCARPHLPSIPTEYGLRLLKHEDREMK